MKRIFCCIFGLATLSLSAQIRFEKGYFIDNTGTRTDCLIRNINWNDTPSEFEYKLSESSPVAIKKDVEVTEFQVGAGKYVNRNIAIDVSSDNLQKLSTHKNPEFETRRILLRVLVDGNASLFHYGKNDLQRFFFSIDNKPIEQLVYKRYDPKQDGRMVVNNYFRQQLWNSAKCEETTESDLEKLDYKRNELIAYFEALNVCNGSSKAEKTAVSKKGSFNLKGSVMFGQHSFSIDSNLYSRDYKSKPYVVFGAEAEYIIPYWNNKWSLSLEPSYNSYQDDDVQENETSSINLKYFAVSFGVRHYFFLADDSKIFVNANIDYLEFATSSKNHFTRNGNDNYPVYDLSDNSVYFSLGAGYNFNRLYLEFRYHLTANPSPYNSVNYEYRNMTLIGRFRIL